jgi:hypothetical protein
MLKSAACAALTAGVAVAAVGLPYMRSRPIRGERNLQSVADFSATANEYLHAPVRLASYGWMGRDHNRLEREMFPGTATLALAAAGVVPPLGAVTIAFLTSGALALDWSLGVNGLTYDELYRWVLPLRSMRVPARFSALVGCALVLLAASGAARLFRRAAERGWLIVVFPLVVSAVLIDLRPRLDLVDYWRGIPSIYASVTPDMVLAEFPLGDRPDYMYFSLSHGARLLNGYSGFAPGNYVDVQSKLEDFPSPATLDVLRSAGVTHITVNCRFYGSRCGTVLRGLDALTGVRPIASGKWEGAEVRLYRIE